MLLKICEFMWREKIASNQQIARALQIDLQALQPMLDIWLRKGILINYQDNSPCRRSSCLKCDKQATVYYKFFGGTRLDEAGR